MIALVAGETAEGDLEEGSLFGLPSLLLLRDAALLASDAVLVGCEDDKGASSCFLGFLCFVRLVERPP